LLTLWLQKIGLYRLLLWGRGLAAELSVDRLRIAHVRMEEAVHRGRDRARRSSHHVGAADRGVREVVERDRVAEEVSCRQAVDEAEIRLDLRGGRGTSTASGDLHVVL